MLRKYAYLLLMAVFASVFFTACDEDDNPIVTDDEIAITTITFGDGTNAWAMSADEVGLDGSYFGINEGAATISGGDLEGNQALTVSTWTDTRIVFTLPTDLADGLYEISIVRNDNEDTEDFEIYVSADEPMISSLATVSISSESLLIGWPMVGIEDWDLFEKYVVSYEHDGQTMMVDVTDDNQVIIDGLNASEAYEFTVYGMYNGTQTNSVMRTWATADRMPESGGTPILLFKSDNATEGSGLQVWDEVVSGPSVLTVADGARWNLGIDTKTDGEIYFGSSSQLEYNITPTYPAQIRTVDGGVTVTPADSLSTFDASPNEALDQYSYEEAAFNLNLIDAGDKLGVMMVVKIPGPAGDNYARVFIPKDQTDDDWLHTDGGDEHLRMYISYQKVAGVPYAGQ